MAAAAAIKISSSSPPPSQININKNPNLLITKQRLSFSRSWALKKMKPSVCCSSKTDQKKAEESGTNSPKDGFPSSDDADYLLKLAAGSVGGGAAIKYGSILFPDLTKPNILEALLMVSLPVIVAVLILIKESMTDNQNDDIF